MGFTSSDFEAIEIAVRATGQQGVTDLENHVTSLKGQINALEAALQNQTKSTKDGIAELSKLTAELKDAQVAAAGAQRVMRGASAAGGDMDRSMRGASQALLEFSRGAEDFATGGFLGTLNNVPRMFGGIAQAAGLAAPQIIAVEAAATLLATAGFAVWKNWDQVQKLFNTGLDVKMIDDIKATQEALKELEAKGFKTALDWSDITRAREELGKLTKEQATYNALKSGKTLEEAEQGKLVSQAITEQGGKVDAVVKAAADSTVTPEGDATREARARLAYINDPKNRNVAGTDAASRVAAQQRLADLQAADRENHLRAARDLVTGAAGGDEAKRAALESLVRGNLDRFVANGASPDFAQALRGSSRAAIQGKEAAEAQAAVDKDQATQEAAANAELDRESRDRVKRENDADAIRKQNEAKARAGDRAAVDLNYNLAVEEIKRINDAKKAQEKVDKEGRDAAIRDQRKDNREAQTARQKQVDAVDDPFLGPAQAAIAQNRLAHVQGSPQAVPEAMLARMLQGQVGQTLRQSGQDPSLAQGVVANAFKEANEKYLGGMARHGNQTDALISIIADLQGQIANQLAKEGMRDARINQLHGFNQRLKQRRPTLLTHSIAAALVSLGFGQAQANEVQAAAQTTPAIVRHQADMAQRQATTTPTRNKTFRGRR